MVVIRDNAYINKVDNNLQNAIKEHNTHDLMVRAPESRWTFTVNDTKSGVARQDT